MSEARDKGGCWNLLGEKSLQGAKTGLRAMRKLHQLWIWPFRIYSFQFTSVTSSHCRLISIWVQFRQRHAYDIGFDRGLERVAESAEIGIIVLWPLYQMGADNEALFASGSTFSLLVCALSSRRHARSNRIRLQEIGQWSVGQRRNTQRQWDLLPASEFCF